MSNLTDKNELTKKNHTIFRFALYCKKKKNVRFHSHSIEITCSVLESDIGTSSTSTTTQNEKKILNINISKFSRDSQTKIKKKKNNLYEQISCEKICFLLIKINKRMTSLISKIRNLV